MLLSGASAGTPTLLTAACAPSTALFTRAGRFDSGCIVAVGVVKTIEHAAAGLPLPRKVQVARAAKAAAGKSAASASARL